MSFYRPYTRAYCKVHTAYEIYLDILEILTNSVLTLEDTVECIVNLLLEADLPWAAPNNSENIEKEENYWLQLLINNYPILCLGR